MTHKFLTDSEFENLPSDPQEAWATTHEIVLRYLDRRRGFFWGTIGHDLQIEAARFLIALANNLELKLGGEPDFFKGKPVQEVWNLFRSFAADMRGDALGRKIKSRHNPNTDAAADRIALSTSGVQRLHLLTAQLRIELTQIDIEEPKRQKLLLRLSDFENEIGRNKVSVSNALAIAAVIFSGIAVTTSALADGPGAIDTLQKITLLLGQEIDNAEEIKKLTAEVQPLQLPSPTNMNSEADAKQ